MEGARFNPSVEEAIKIFPGLLFGFSFLASTSWPPLVSYKTSADAD
jgi:hypothetical protein